MSDIQLDENQREVVTYPEDDCLVVAGPGAGKTRSIVHRVGHLLDKGVDPRKIVGISFTNDASNELHRRVSENHPQGGQIHSKTTHSFCYGLYREHFDKVGVCQPWTANGMIRFLFGKLNYGGDMSAKGVLSEINTLKRQAKDYEEIVSELKKIEEGDATLAEIFEEYENIKQKENVIDFSDMLWLLWRGLRRDKYARREVQRRFDHIIVDESQDMSVLSLETIKMISGEANLTLMGDPRQSIYGFREADPELIMDIEEERDMDRLYLENNYRSFSEIVGMTNELISDDPIGGSFPDCDAVREGAGTVEFHRPEDRSSEAETIINLIENSDYDLDDWGIIYRKNSQSAFIEVELMKNDIPYSVSGRSFWNRDEIDTSIAYLELLESGFQSFDAFEVVYNEPNRYLGKKFIERAEEIYKRNGEDVISITATIAQESNGYMADNARHLYECLTDLDSRKGCSPGEILEEVIYKYPSLSRSRMLFEDLNKGGITKADRKSNLESFANIAYEYASVTSFLDDIANLDNMESDEGVNLLTVHASKGLEYPAVALAGFVDGLLPHHNGEFGEERRMAFVAMTRAEDELHLMEPQEYNGEMTDRSEILSKVLDVADV